ncbi:zinc finger and BTB domain-containing protein 22b [Triplophysa dalaica]|uniref:zinc finger and BTB domain-containing protein 22b n=1 Tax=Triplophysa dalaica TaxID=1582913 RepID=UPI0024DF8329|nr:zinc finger and BTB domain-containing protein 22b [Triplophysa dalaica]XP_056598007.1 zinc finger and BTB domain-containing protein 22b [Triplophysa dalaica]
MQSVTVEQDYGDPSGSVVQVCFPSVQTSVLDSLNRQREEGHLCDLSIHVQGQVFKAHRCVLAASSPYFHDQVLLKNMSTVSIPAAMDPLAFESVLSCAYTGQLRMLRDDIVNYLTVGSVLQMWHIVDKCTELLREARGGSSGPQGTGEKTNAGLSGCSNKVSQAEREDTLSSPHPPNRPSFSESQSPSSTNYFSPREANFGGGTVTTGAVGESVVHSTPTYCTPSGGEEGFLMEEEEDDELLFSRNREREGGKRKNSTSVSDQEVGVSDSFGVSSYQGGDATPPQRRPSYSQPSIMPRKQWVVVKTENSRDDDLIVVSGEEGGEDEEEREMEMVRERDRAFNISNVRTLSGLREQAEMEAQGDYCQSSEDYLKFDRGLLDQTSSHHHPSENPSQCTSRAVSALLSSVQSTSARAQLFPLDMQGNQIFLYNQAALESTSPLGHAGGIPIKSSLEHGAVPLPGQSTLGSGIEGLDGGGAGGPGKVFMCHCGKTFTHKSMRDRHINMHLDLRPFHCPVCSKKFKMKHHLTEHMKTHTGLKPYDCHACGKKFMWRDSFMRHRSHCERRSLGGNSADGSIISPPHHLKLQTSVGESSQSRSVVSGQHTISSSGVSCLGMAAAGSFLGIGSQSGVHSLGSVGGGRVDEMCEGDVDESSVT